MIIDSIPSVQVLKSYIMVRDVTVSADTQPHAADGEDHTQKASSFGKILEKLKYSAVPESLTDQERLAQIAQKLQENAYDVPGVHVADRMLEK